MGTSKPKVWVPPFLIFKGAQGTVPAGRRELLLAELDGIGFAAQGHAHAC